jgi:hypothetical protein
LSTVTGVAANRLDSAQQVLLLCALALGVMAMHHVSAATSPSGSAMTHAAPDAPIAMVAAMSDDSGEHHPGMPDGAHDLLHLCLAVLCAVVTFLLTLFLLSRFIMTTVGAPSSPRGSPIPERPPDRRGRRILTSLCVLRT